MPPPSSAKAFSQGSGKGRGGRGSSSMGTGKGGQASSQGGNADWEAPRRQYAGHQRPAITRVRVGEQMHATVIRCNRKQVESDLWVSKHKIDLCVSCVGHRSEKFNDGQRARYTSLGALSGGDQPEHVTVSAIAPKSSAQGAVGGVQGHRGGGNS